MLSVTKQNLKAALVALHNADFSGTPDDFSEYESRIMLNEIAAICRALDPDYYAPPFDVDDVPFPFEDARQ